MEVILVKDMKKKGRVGDVISVKAGYALNFLIPHGIAVPADKQNLNSLDVMKKRHLKQLEARRGEFEKIAQKVNGQQLTFKCKMNKGKLYGSIAPNDVLKALNETYKVSIEKRDIDMPDHIKQLGDYTITVNLHPEIECQFTITVAPDKNVEEPTDYSETEEGVQAAETAKAKKAVEREKAEAARAAAEVDDAEASDDSDNDSTEDDELSQ